MTLTYVRKSLPTTYNDTTHVNTSVHEHEHPSMNYRLKVTSVYWSPNHPSAPLPPLHTLITTSSAQDTVCPTIR
ncbi:hypothetical protein HPB48_000740 [Haemaphysalis longicornis]|uniref:Uncharacterized protein n=1 Tax=Haemaphysalis longicornis TaxID=44386 RepID=A0A9J6GXZ9_HAELO|nr:hypothetical protein HPB48_000740 [Haemaphysalis longicornis]